MNNSTFSSRPGGLTAWFASNPVAANLLMALIVIGGFAGLELMDKEVFPRFSLQQIEVTAEYPGAGPLEIEESVCVRIEEAVSDMPGLKRQSSGIHEGRCNVIVSLYPGYDQDQAIDAMRGRIQNIPRLPKGLEKIDIRPATRTGDDGVIWVALHGPTDPLTLQRYGETIRSDLEQIPGVLRVRNYGEIPYEIVIEVASVKLNQYHLTLHEVAEAVRRASLDQTGGLVKTPSGELQLRVKGKAQDVNSIGNLVLRTHEDGARLRLGDVAVIRDGLEEKTSEWRHNGETAQGWEIHTKFSSVEVARRVKDYVADKRAHLPEGLRITTWWDDSQAYDERVRTLVEDGLGGFVLVCLVLTLFLQLRVAFWAGVGIFTSILGALWTMPILDVSLNMLSLFGFLLAMGILVDDAIIIGESVFTHQQSAPGLPGAIAGVQSVALPVILSVMVALAAFLPGLFLPGWAGQMMKPICLVMILTLVFSLVEALLILPSHLAVSDHSEPSGSSLERLRIKLNGYLQSFVERVYRPFLQQALAWRYLTVSAFIVLLLLCGAWLESGRMRMSLQADVVKDSFWVSLTAPKDAPYSEIRERADQVERAFFSLRNELDGVGLAGVDARKPSVIVGLETMIWEHGAGFWTEFSPEGRQRIIVEDFINEWRKQVGDLGRTKIDFLYKEGDVPYDIELDLGAADPEVLPKAAASLEQALKSYPGVYDVVDSGEKGKPEIRLSLKPEAERLGLRLEDLSEQVRHGYYGDEVQRLQRGRSEVKVMVRYPREERRSLDSLASLPVQLPDGQYAPLGTLANVSLTPGVAKIIRQDRRRVLKVQARVDSQQADVNAIYADLEQGELPRLRMRFPGLSIGIGQAHQEQQLMLETLAGNTLVSLLVIYVLIAVPFRSYSKPLIFLLAAPVAWCGAVIAHGLAGLPLSMESLVGMIAASGVVVNDSLVLLDYMKEHDSPDKPVADLICEACTVRFRPIFLAFLTNFAGFLPALLETSPQAQFLIPMTLSLSAGLLLGMSASLVLTPVCYSITAKT